MELGNLRETLRPLLWANRNFQAPLGIPWYPGPRLRKLLVFVNVNWKRIARNSIDPCPVVSIDRTSGNWVRWYVRFCPPFSWNEKLKLNYALNDGIGLLSKRGSKLHVKTATGKSGTRNNLLNYDGLMKIRASRRNKMSATINFVFTLQLPIK